MKWSKKKKEEKWKKKKNGALSLLSLEGSEDRFFLEAIQAMILKAEGPLEKRGAAQPQQQIPKSNAVFSLRLLGSIQGNLTYLAA